MNLGLNNATIPEVMNNYLLTLVFKNDLEDKKRQSTLEALTKNFGKMTKEDVWGSRNLAYPIKHAEKGFYAHYEFESEPQTIAILDRQIRLNEDIIRYLLIKKD